MDLNRVCVVGLPPPKWIEARSAAHEEPVGRTMAERRKGCSVAAEDQNVRAPLEFSAQLKDWLLKKEGGGNAKVVAAGCWALPWEA